MNDGHLKQCKFCGKEVNHLARHIVNMHPSVMEQVEETAILNPPSEPPKAVKEAAQNLKTGDINALIREKLDLMLNIKIIEMLSSSKSPTLQELQSAINPPQKSSLQELKEYHDLVYGDEPRYIETGDKWIDIAQQALPMVKDMMQKKKVQGGNNESDRINEQSPGILKPIQSQAPGNTTESAGISPESGAPGDANK